MNHNFKYILLTVLVLGSFESAASPQGETEAAQPCKTMKPHQATEAPKQKDSYATVHSNEPTDSAYNMVVTGLTMLAGMALDAGCQTQGEALAFLFALNDDYRHDDVSLKLYRVVFNIERAKRQLAERAKRQLAKEL